MWDEHRDFWLLEMWTKYLRFKNHNTQPKYGLIVKSYLFPSTWLTKEDRRGLVVDSYYNIKLSASDPKLHSMLPFFPLGCMIDNQSDIIVFI